MNGFRGHPRRLSSTSSTELRSWQLRPQKWKCSSTGSAFIWDSERLARIAISREVSEGISMTTADITGQLARYMAEARDLRLAPHVRREAKHPILDTLAATVSCSHLQAGAM